MTERILIVEDEAVLRKHLGRLFLREGYKVVTAGTRAEAFAALSGGQFEVLLLDVKLPDGDGFELLATLDAQQRPPRIVVMTAFSTPENEARAQGLNIVHMFPKPVDLCQLINAVQHRALPVGW